MANRYIETLVRFANNDVDFYDNVVKNWIRKSRKYDCYDEYFDIVINSTSDESLETVTYRIDELFKVKRKEYLADRKVRRESNVSDRNKFLELIESSELE